MHRAYRAADCDGRATQWFYAQCFISLSYLFFLQKVLPPLLDDANVSSVMHSSVWFQHDEAPTHNSIDVHLHLNAVYGRQRSRAGMSSALARSIFEPHFPFFISYGATSSHWLFSNESCFHLCPDDQRRSVWRRPGQRANPAFTIVRHTGIQQGVMVWGAISFEVGHLCDNVKPHTTRIAMNYFTAYQTFPWLARSPDPSPIEHVWDMMGRRLHLPGNVDDLAQQLEHIWQEMPQDTVRVLYHFMSRLVAAGRLHPG
ncbi:transposable element Tc1 transposase [Trichonephila clavipes]|nr:transposable element Tc1 transposase [Trichonephila clavipes]